MILIKIAYLFIIGCVFGWVVELFYRRFVTNRPNWVNPGFLNGPFLPIYGFGALLLFVISQRIESLPILIATMFIALTLIELFTGYIFNKYFHIRLWDYREEKFNYKGYICPLFSVFWTVLGVLFYYFLYPTLSQLIGNVNSIEGYIVGCISGMLIIDVFMSFNILFKIKNTIQSLDTGFYSKTIDYTILKFESRRANTSKKIVPKFFHNFGDTDILEHIKNIGNKKD